MRNKSVFNFRRSLPCMSWSPRNLYNLWKRTAGPKSDDILFKKTSDATLFQQRWKSKAAVRAYHGDYIPEKVFKRWYLPDSLPDVRPRRQVFSGDIEDLELYARRKLKEKQQEEEIEEKGLAPVGSLMFSEVERRIDTVVFRSCFAHSIYEARRLIIHGDVKLNGKKHTNATTRLAPGDMISVNPDAIRFFKLPNGEYDDVNAGESRIKLVPEEEEVEVEVETDAEQTLESSLEPQTTSESKTEQTPESSQTPSESDTEQTPESSLQPQAPSESETEQIPESSLQPQTSESVTEQTPESSLEPQIPSESETEHIPESSLQPQTSESETEQTPESSLEPQIPSESKRVSKPKPKAKSDKPPLTPFYLPPYASPWLFIPAYIEPSFATCSVVYVRHPTARPGYSEIPTPYDADGTLIRYAWEWYMQRRPRMRSKSQLSRMPEDRAKIPTDVGKERRLLLQDIKPSRNPGYFVKDVRKYSEFGTPGQ